MEERPSTTAGELGLTNRDEQRLKGLYHERLRVHGDSHLTVGWRSREDQFLRFEMLCRGLDLRRKRVLDVGCGLGTFVDYADGVFGGDFDYVGIDISDQLVAEARAVRGNHRRKFYEGTLGESMVFEPFDVCVLSGTLSFKTDDNTGVMERTLSHAFVISREAVCCNFLSSYVDFQLDKNFHYRPEDVFAYAKRLTKWVRLYHDYPLHEFTIQMLHTPSSAKEKP